MNRFLTIIAYWAAVGIALYLGSSVAHALGASYNLVGLIGYFFGLAGIAGYFKIFGIESFNRTVSSESSGPTLVRKAPPGTMEYIEEAVVIGIASVYDNEPNDFYREKAKPIMEDVRAYLGSVKTVVKDPEYLKQLHEQRTAAHKKITWYLENGFESLVPKQRTEVERINKEIAEQLEP